MSTENINPEKITKPIQLLGAWLLGLILIDTTFLTAASQVTKPEWAAGLLVIAAVINVPLFLFSLFLLQTKFRPEMQEDTYYSKHLERTYSNATLGKDQKKLMEADEKETKVFAELITKELSKEPIENKKEKIEVMLKSRDKQRLERKIDGSRALSELYIYPNKWSDLVERFKDNSSFIRDLEELLFHKVIEGDLTNPISLRLTELGMELGKKLFDEKVLWNQKHDKKIIV